MYESAVELELGRLIPPKDGLPNIVYRIPQEGEEFYDRVSNLSVVAGHFAWGVWTELPYWIGENQTRPPPCFIMGRHPVERVISYYYQRCFRYCVKFIAVIRTCRMLTGCAERRVARTT